MTRRDERAPRAAFDLSPLFAAETARLRHALDAAAAGSGPAEVEPAVHAARRRLKTLRAMLRVLGKPQDDPRRKAIDDALRALAGSLSRTRDLHVASATVLALRRRVKSGKAGGGRKDRKALRMRLAALAAQWNDRAAAAERGRLTSRGDAPALEVVERMLDDLGPALSPDELAETLARTYAKARDALADALTQENADVLHAARGQVVRHQLQMKLVVALTGRGARRVEELGRLRQWLGRHHDLAVAEAMAGETPHEAGFGSAFAVLVQAEQRALAARCRPQAEALFRRKPEAMRARLATQLDAALAGRQPG